MVVITWAANYPYLPPVNYSSMQACSPSATATPVFMTMNKHILSAPKTSNEQRAKKWNPDKRAKDKLPYTEEHIGMPEWGIRHFAKPYADNRGWRTPYRDINNAVIPGTVLAASLFDVRAEWNHDAIF